MDSSSPDNRTRKATLGVVPACVGPPEGGRTALPKGLRRCLLRSSFAASPMTCWYISSVPNAPRSTPRSWHLPEPAEELADVAHEEVGGVVGGPVTAAVELAPGDDVGVVAFGEFADRPEVIGETRKADGHRGRPGRVFGMLVFVVEAGRRCRGVGQPVDRDVGQDLIGAKCLPEQLAAPGELTGGRVGESVRQVLRLRLL